MANDLPRECVRRIVADKTSDQRPDGVRPGAITISAARAGIVADVASETLDALVDEGALVEVDGRYRLATEP